jgi:hypothetical protein
MAASSSDFGAAMGRIAGHFAPLGVHTYEIWNEPNHSFFWPSGINAADYGDLLKHAATAIRSVDSSSKIVLGGLSKNDAGYLSQLYSLGFRKYFDIVAVHPYTGGVSPKLCWNKNGKPAPDAFCGIRTVRDVMVANYDSAKPIWLTEFGVSTAPVTYGVSEAAQAQYLQDATDMLRESYPYVEQAFYFSLRNIADHPLDLAGNSGLLHRDFSPKPAWATFKSLNGA